MNTPLRNAFLFATLVGGAASLAWAGKSGGGGGGDWEIDGHYYDTCDCSVSCSCGANVSDPTEGHCDGIVLTHIDKGHVGKTKLDGLNIAIVLRSPRGQKVEDAFMVKGEMDHLTVYLDGKATDEQKQAMPVLLAGLLGTKPIKGFKPPQFVPMSLDVEGDIAKFKVGDGQKLSFEIENIDVTKSSPNVRKPDYPSKRITLTNVAPFPWIHEVTQGHSKSFHYNDYGIKWDYAGRNAFFGVAHAKGPLPAPATK